MNCGKVVAENCKTAPIADIVAPVRSVFFRPRRSPNIAAEKQPARFPSLVVSSMSLAILTSAYRETAGCDSLDVGVFSLRECFNEVGADQDSTDDSLIISIPCLGCRISCGEDNLECRTGELSFGSHSFKCNEDLKVVVV